MKITPTLILSSQVLAVASGAFTFYAALRGAPEAKALTLTGDFPGAHDPSIIKQGKTWYVFTTGRAPDGGQFAVRSSPDLLNWKLVGHVFDKLPDWVHETSPGTRDLWAPDVSFVDGEFRVYYAYSLFGRNTSGIGLAVNKSLDPLSPDNKWIDKGLVLKSVETDDFNAIDPNFIRDRKGRDWLSFGSFWGGIKMRELDRKTGKLLDSNPQLYSLAGREKPAQTGPNPPNLPPNWQAVEAPYIVRHGDFYYLFVSWDLCCRGVKSTYRTMVGRSKEVTGPYEDRTGKSLVVGGGSPLLAGNARWIGPGGESVYLPKGGPDIIAFHAYDGVTGRPALQISTLAWVDGWPEAQLADK